MNFSGGLSPHCDRALLPPNEVGAVGEIEPVAVGPMLVDAAPGIGPVVVDLAAEHVAADAPHVLVLAELLRYSWPMNTSSMSGTSNEK